MCLCDLKIGDKAIITSNNSGENIKRRLLDIGLVNGTKIECVLKSPFKDIKAYLIRGALIAIRNIDTKNIKVIKI